MFYQNIPCCWVSSVFQFSWIPIPLSYYINKKWNDSMCEMQKNTFLFVMLMIFHMMCRWGVQGAEWTDTAAVQREWTSQVWGDQVAVESGLHCLLPPGSAVVQSQDHLPWTPQGEGKLTVIFALGEISSENVTFYGKPFKNYIIYCIICSCSYQK